MLAENTNTLTYFCLASFSVRIGDDDDDDDVYDDLIAAISKVFSLKLYYSAQQQ